MHKHRFIIGPPMPSTIGLPRGNNGSHTIMPEHSSMYTFTTMQTGATIAD